jgi:sialate O-acetylesterase
MHNYNILISVKRKIKICSLLCFLCFVGGTAGAQLSVAAVFGNNAVLQQGAPIPVWGKAAPADTVTVLFAGFSVKSIADANGNWMSYLPAMKADGQAYELLVESAGEILRYKNILLGEVWLASGQSNMAYKVGADLLNRNVEISNANYPAIRFRMVDQSTAIVPASDIAKQDWQICTPQNVEAFSAVGYFFARELHLDQKIPVGIIVAARGATSIESWMSKQRLINHPEFKEILTKRNEDPLQWNNFVKESLQKEAERERIAKTSFIGLEKGVTKINFNDSQWKKNNFPLSAQSMGYGSYWGLVWLRKSFEISAGQAKKNWNLFLPLKDQRDNVYLNQVEIVKDISKLQGQKIALKKHSLQPGKNILAIRLYANWGIADIGDRNSNAFLYSSNGDTILLTGQWAHSNTIEPAVAGWQDYYNRHTVNYNAMIHPLIPYGIRGFLWYQGENNASKAKQYAELQPMLIDDWRVRWQRGYAPFLFVQLASYKARSNSPLANDDWAQFRDAQRSTLFSSHNSAMACAIDIGDEFNIHPSNKQEIGRRLCLAAQQQVYHQNIIGSGPLFKTAIIQGDQVSISFNYVGNGLVNKGNSPIAGFAVSDSSGKWFWANAFIDGQTIVVSSKEVLHPVRVQYAWQSNPMVTLYNSSGLPVIPFNEKVIQ